MGKPNVATQDSGTLAAHPLIIKLFVLFMALPFVTAPLLSIHFPKVVAYIMPASGLIGSIILILGLKLKPSLPRGVIIYAASALALMAASCFWAFYPDEAWDRLTKIGILIPFSLLFMATLSGGNRALNLNILIDVILVSASLGALLLCADILNDGYIYRLSRGELDGPLYSTAVYNKGSIVVAVLGMVAFALSPSRKKLALLLPLALMLYLIQSQATQVGLLLGVLVYFLFPYKLRWAWLAAFFVVVAGFALKPVLAPIAYDQFAQSFQSVDYMKEAYAAHRLEIWDYISREIWASPFIGHGIEFTRSFDGFDSAKIFLPEVNPMHPHSFILQIWIELGVIGIAFALAGIGFLFKAIYNIADARIQRTAFSTLAVLVFTASITFGLWQGWWLVFLMMTASLFVMVVNNRKA